VASRIDNTAPAATLSPPAATLSGTVTLSATAADAGSGIASVQFQRAPAGTTNWTTICTDTSAAYSCAWDTAGETGGLYDLRVVATDVAGNERTSATVTNRRVDNDGPAVSLADPGSVLRGSVNLTATATDPIGVASVTIQGAAAGTSTWIDICTKATAPYSCPFNTAGIPDGLYDLRATAVDTAGRTSTSAVIASRRVDNTAPAGTDVQAVNGTGAQYKIDAGDVITFSYSEAMAPASILAGWDGSALNVTVRVNNNANADTITIHNAANTTQLNLSNLQLRANHVTSATRFAGTAEMNGNQVVVTLGALANGSTRTTTSTTPMRWTPVAAATDLAGNSASTATVNESGTTDRDF
jgi:hypothetical protein